MNNGEKPMNRIAKFARLVFFVFLGQALMVPSPQACERDHLTTHSSPTVSSDDALRASLRAVGSITTGFDRARDAVCFRNGERRVGNQFLTRVHGRLGTCHGISALEAAFFERARFNPSEPRVGYQYDDQGNRINRATREDLSDRTYFTDQATSAVLALWETGCPGTVSIPGFEGLNEFCSQGENRDTFADVAYALNLRQSAALLSEFSLDVILTQQTPAESRAITRTSLLQILERAERGQTSRILFRPRDPSGAEPVFRRNGSFRMREGDGLAMSHIGLVTGVEIEENTGQPRRLPLRALFSARRFTGAPAFTFRNANEARFKCSRNL